MKIVPHAALSLALFNTFFLGGERFDPGGGDTPGIGCGLYLSEIFTDSGQYPLDPLSTENYLRWHSDPGSANRLSGKVDPEDRFHARGVSPCFDSNRE